ncbi:AsnC family transcriptional regulator [Candidatus Woesearchaeota archaeon]|nr:AsnC family transcriptional regulator [Candidatus Woesearchaeota archaeon]
MAGIVYGKEQKVDAKDKKLLKVLFQDGRMSIADLAKKTGLRRDSVARRLKRLREEEVVTAFIPIINPPALGYPNIAILLLRTKPGEDKAKFLNKLKVNKFIVHIAKLIGKFDAYCAIVYRDTNHLNSIIDEIKTYSALDDFEIYQVAAEEKFEDMESLLHN